MKGRQRKDLDEDQQLVFALIRCLEIIGEAAARISEEFREEHCDVPWGRMVGTRNRLIHAYWDINLDIVWHTVSEELPTLAKEIKNLLNLEDES